jgi:hypothetical protein
VILWFYNTKSVFLAVNASLRWLNNDSGVFLVQDSFPCFLLVSRVWDISSGIGPCLPLKFYANAGGKQSIQRQPLVISGNDKNKQLTLLSQSKLSLTTRNTLFALQNHWSTYEI